MVSQTSDDNKWSVYVVQDTIFSYKFYSFEVITDKKMSVLFDSIIYCTYFVLWLLNMVTRISFNVPNLTRMELACQLT